MIITINKPIDQVAPNQLENEIRKIYSGPFAVYRDDVEYEYFLDFAQNEIDDDIVQAIANVIDNHVPHLDVPEAVGPAQLRIALRRLHNITSTALEAAVGQFIASISDGNDRADAQDLWTYATLIQRSHPLVSAIGLALGLNNRQIDETFVLAATI